MSRKYLWATVFLFLSYSMLEAKPLSRTGTFFKESSWRFFPVPIFKTLPAEGQTYGIMPVLVGSGEDLAIRTIVALAETYNKVTGPSTFLTSYIYPTPQDTLFFFGELALRHARETTLRYSHYQKAKGTWIYEGQVSYLQYPFERFFGFGPKTTSANETSFVSENLGGYVDFGYHLFSSLIASYRLRIDHWQLHPGVLPMVADTLNIFGGNPEVVSTTNLLHRLELQYNTHSDPFFAERGEKLAAAYLVSSRPLGSDFTWQGYDLQGKLTRSFISDRLTTVVLGQLEQRFGGTIPFHLQSSLGGSRTLRAFLERRYTARHRFNLELEERIEVFQSKIQNTLVVLSLDPFISIGQVFDHFSEISVADLRTVGGLGIRMKAKPAIVGRLDLGFGKEGMQVYATVDYPF